MWSLLFAEAHVLWPDKSDAQRRQFVDGLAGSELKRQSYFEKADGGDSPAGVLLFTLWQKLLACYSPTTPLAPFHVTAHLDLLSFFEGRGLSAGKIVALGNGSRHQLPQIICLPCRNCGHVFESNPRAGRFNRVCGQCEPNKLGKTLAAHPTAESGGLFGGDLLHTSRRRGSEWQEAVFTEIVLCAHPDCLEFFLRTASNREYCEECRRRHPRNLARARRESSPKNERFEFSLAAGVRSSYWHPIRGEVVIADSQWRQAEDLRELVQFAKWAQQDMMTVRRSPVT